MFPTQDIQKNLDTMKRPNIRIIGIEEVEESQLKGYKNTFNNHRKRFPNLKKEIPITGGFTPACQFLNIHSEV